MWRIFRKSAIFLAAIILSRKYFTCLAVFQELRHIFSRHDIIRNFLSPWYLKLGHFGAFLSKVVIPSLSFFTDLNLIFVFIVCSVVILA